MLPSSHKISLLCLLGLFVAALPAALMAAGPKPPRADHHAHLASPTAARLLRQFAIPQAGEASKGEEEKSATATDLIAALDAAGIQRATALSEAYRLGSPFVHIPQEAAAVDAENEWTLRQVRLFPQRLAGFCSVNPTRPYALAAIEHCARIGLRGGLKLHLANAQFNFEDPAQLRRLGNVFLAANRLRMPILIHLRSDQVWDPKKTVQVFVNRLLPLAPDIPVQVAHLGGWGGYDRSTDAAFSTFAEECAAHPDRCRRLYFDLAAVVLTAADAKAAPGSDSRLLWEDQKDFVDGPERLATTLRRVGLSRILFATDWPLVTGSEYANTLRTNLRLTGAEIDQIFGNLAPYFP